MHPTLHAFPSCCSVSSRQHVKKKFTRSLTKSSVSPTSPHASWACSGTLAIQAVHGPSCCSIERPPNERMYISLQLAMSTVNGTLPARCNLLHYHSIFGAAFYIWCCLNIGLRAATADPVHLVSPPMENSLYYRDHGLCSSTSCCISQCPVHYTVKFDADVFIQSGVNSYWQPPSWIFRLCEFGHSGVLIVWYLCFVPNLVQISVIVTQIDAVSIKPSFDDVTRINFRFRLLVTWSSPHGRDASSHKIWCIYLYSVQSYWHFPEIKDGCRHYLGFVGGSHGTTHEGVFLVRTACKNFVVIG